MSGKARLENIDTGEDVFTCQFNPTDFTEDKSNSVSAQTKKGKDVPKFEFSGGGAHTLNLKLLLDDSESPAGRIASDVKKLQAMTAILKKTEDPKTHRGRPPLVRFIWGDYTGFKAIITKLSVQYTLFQSDGTAIRATVTLSLQESEDKQLKPQNPSSVGEPGQKLRHIRPGDTLALLAFEEYDDPTQWRRIADANRMENPRNLVTGRLIVIPPR